MANPNDLQQVRSLKAKNRLSDMLAQEVSIVRAAANLRRFVLLKQRDTMEDQAKAFPPKPPVAPEAPPAPPAAATEPTPEEKPNMKLPPMVKQSLLDGIAQSLEDLSGMAMAIGNAEEDEAAPVPPELVSAIDKCGMKVSGLGAQYAPKPDAAEKDVPSGIKVGGMTEEPAPAAEPAAPAVPAKPDDEDMAKAELAKAGKKLAGHRREMIMQAKECLDKLLAETEEPPLVDPITKPMAKSADQEPAPVATDAIADIRKAIADLAAVVKSQSAVPVQKGAAGPISNVIPTDDAHPGTAKQPFQWDDDLSAAVAAKSNLGRAPR